MIPDGDPIFEQAIQDAALIFAQARVERDSLSPRKAAEAAWYPGHSLGTVEAIEALIVSQRAEAAEQWRDGTHPYQLRRQMIPKAA